MNNSKPRMPRSHWGGWLLLLGLLLMAGVALAQSGGEYDLSWNTVDGGGVTFAAGGNYRLGGTIGQPDAGLSTGGAYALDGGFWGRGAVLPYRYKVYLPLGVRGY